VNVKSWHQKKKQTISSTKTVKGHIGKTLTYNYRSPGLEQDHADDLARACRRARGRRGCRLCRNERSDSKISRARDANHSAEVFSWRGGDAERTQDHEMMERTIAATFDRGGPHYRELRELFRVLHMAYEESKKLADELLDEDEQ